MRRILPRATLPTILPMVCTQLRCHHLQVKRFLLRKWEIKMSTGKRKAIKYLEDLNSPEQKQPLSYGKDSTGRILASEAAWLLPLVVKRSCRRWAWQWWNPLHSTNGQWRSQKHAYHVTVRPDDDNPFTEYIGHKGTALNCIININIFQIIGK